MPWQNVWRSRSKTQIFEVLSGFLILNSAQIRLSKASGPVSDEWTVSYTQGNHDAKEVLEPYYVRISTVNPTNSNPQSAMGKMLRLLGLRRESVIRKSLLYTRLFTRLTVCTMHSAFRMF